MYKKLKKGFTIVELVIVIAVIGILSAVLIPTFSGLVNKANLAADETLVRNINQQLQIAGDTEKNGTMSQALEDAKEAGYLVESINAKSSGNQLVWDSTIDRFALVDKDGNLVAGQLSASKNVDVWVIAKSYSNADGYSIYLQKGYNGEKELTITTGLDVGENTNITKITYDRHDAAVGQTVTINTGAEGCNLVVNAPKDTVNHYSYLLNLDVQAVDATHSYHEFGTVKGRANVVDGHVVVEPKGYVNELKVDETAPATTKVDIQATGEVKNLVVDSEVAQVVVKPSASVETVVAPAAATNVTIPASVEVEQVQKTEVSNEAELKAALENGDKYIVFTADITAGKWSSSDNVGASITSDVVLDGAGHTFTTTAGRAIWVDDSNVSATIKNMKIVGGSSTERGIQVNGGCTGVELVIDNVELSGITHYGINICNNAGVIINLTNSKITSWGCLNLWAANYQVYVNNCELNGLNNKAYNADGWNDFATIVLEGDTTGATEDHSSNITVDIKNSKITASTTGQGNKQSLIGFNTGAKYNVVSFSDCEFVTSDANHAGYCLGEGNSIILDGESFELPSGCYFGL